jgi:hypothetical protein
MKRSLARISVIVPLLAVVVGAGAGPAAGHEGRTGGPLRFVVGWGDEPAYTGAKNSVQVTITEATGGAPVTDLTDTLKVEVIKGGEKLTLPLAPNFRVGASGTPGDYRAWLTPTRPGAYTFRLTGTVRGQNVNESFSSSPTTFNDVEDAANIQFPEKDPSPGQLATRVDREVPRLDAALAKAEGDAADARMLGLVGVAVGAAGLLVGALALVASRRRDAGAGRAAGERTPQESLSR